MDDDYLQRLEEELSSMTLKEIDAKLCSIAWSKNSDKRDYAERHYLRRIRDNTALKSNISLVLSAIAVIASVLIPLFK
ncbi:hypothetical protein DA717_13655 [Piscirickettsiaceae bacterium NZ-RLO2]|nr:hypothetical protein DA717_13655 [Piscirickettsiaceae bacterium NZ-RLO2]